MRVLLQVTKGPSGLKLHCILEQAGNVHELYTFDKVSPLTPLQMIMASGKLLPNKLTAACRLPPSLMWPWYSSSLCVYHTCHDATSSA